MNTDNEEKSTPTYHTGNKPTPRVSRYSKAILRGKRLRPRGKTVAKGEISQHSPSQCFALLARMIARHYLYHHSTAPCGVFHPHVTRSTGPPRFVGVPIGGYVVSTGHYWLILARAELAYCHMAVTREPAIRVIVFGTVALTG